LIESDVDVVPLRGVVEQPVGHRSTTDEDELVVGFVEEDPVADHPTLWRHRHELLGAVDREAGDAVDAGLGDQPERVGTGDEQVDHVVALVVQHHRIAPRVDLPAEVGELRGHDGIDVRAELRVAKQFDGVAGLVEHFLQVASGHVVPS
jgi:hypothetical protein